MSRIIEKILKPRDVSSAVLRYGVIVWGEFMIIFNSDLDNTLIYSYKRDIPDEKICVEIYNERQISFMTRNSYELLKKIVKKVLFVPTTTRTVEQYERIDLGIGVPQFSLVCNGGVLLNNGKEDKEWYKESLRLISVCFEELKKAEKILYEDEYRCFDVRNISELFIFTKSDKPFMSVQRLKGVLNLSLVDVFENGIKIYVIPKKLSKGMALRRFKEKINGNTFISAGDSEFDISMIREADFGIVPNYMMREKVGENGIIVEDNFFSDGILNFVLNLAEKNVERRSDFLL